MAREYKQQSQQQRPVDSSSYRLALEWSPMSYKVVSVWNANEALRIHLTNKLKEHVRILDGKGLQVTSDDVSRYTGRIQQKPDLALIIGWFGTDEAKLGEYLDATMGRICAKYPVKYAIEDFAILSQPVQQKAASPRQRA